MEVLLVAEPIGSEENDPGHRTAISLNKFLRGERNRIEEKTPCDNVTREEKVFRRDIEVSKVLYLGEAVDQEGGGKRERKGGEIVEGLAAQRRMNGAKGGRERDLKRTSTPPEGL